MSTHDKKTALITGANRGLGLATAEALARRGYRVILTARSQQAADEAAASLTAEGLDAHGVELDVASDASVEAGLAAALEIAGSIDALINNAGTIFERDDNSPQAIDAAMMATAFNTNTLGAHRTMQALVPRMIAAGYGRVVNVSSGLGALTDMGGGYTAYRASKAALNAITRVYAHEAGQADGDVKVNAVCPGWVRTDMGGPNAHRSLEQGIAGIVWAATLPADGPNNGFFRDGEAIDW